jgi:KUP system potassium uptake protein
VLAGDETHQDDHSHGRTAGVALSVGALGVVFGDIGTSPLYALRESLGEEYGLAGTRNDVLGILSLMFWSLLIVITLKYLIIVMRADNRGEGGILALVALIGGTNRARNLILLGLFGTALLYGDGMITPAISVLSAVEGLQVAAPSLEPAVIPIVLVILVGLFAVQRRGTEAIGRFFGPVMVVWFGVLALLGVIEIASGPEVLEALNPLHAARFFLDNGFKGLLVLGSVFLVVTGGEALYADMGHFGRPAITRSWFAVVLPALVLNYFGQGALVLSDPDAAENPFFLLAPSWAQWPLTILATLATVIASQALISGAFSLTVQAVQLGYLPRLRHLHTSGHHIGHVYVPAINWFLLAACITLVLTFGSSTRLASAYGLAVTLTMLLTTVLVAAVALRLWSWPRVPTLVAAGLLAVVDSAFLGANLFKIPSGGWLPLVIGVVGFVLFTTWRTGRDLVAERVERRGLTLERFVEQLSAHPPTRHAGTGVYLHRTAGLVPPALLANLRHNESLHETVITLSIMTDEVPRVPPALRLSLREIGDGFHQAVLHYGFLETPDVATDLAAHALGDVSVDPQHTTWYLGREHVEVTERPGMAIWREHLFAFLSRNAADPSRYFELPVERTVDIGIHVEL